jgi:hypothetical protein
LLLLLLLFMLLLLLLLLLRWLIMVLEKSLEAQNLVDLTN